MASVLAVIDIIHDGHVDAEAAHRVDERGNRAVAHAGQLADVVVAAVGEVGTTVKQLDLDDRVGTVLARRNGYVEQLETTPLLQGIVAVIATTAPAAVAPESSTGRYSSLNRRQMSSSLTSRLVSSA